MSQESNNNPTESPRERKNRLARERRARAKAERSAAAESTTPPAVEQTPEESPTEAPAPAAAEVPTGPVTTVTPGGVVETPASTPPAEANPLDQLQNSEQKYHPDFLRAMRAYRRSKPWQGTNEERGAKLQTVHEVVRRVYELGELKLDFEKLDGGPSQFYILPDVPPTLVITGKISVITYLVAIASLRGRRGRDAYTWVMTLFKRIFPHSYGKCRVEGAFIVKQE